MTRISQLRSLVLSSCLLFGCTQSPQKQVKQEPFIQKTSPKLNLLAGTYTNEESQGIYQLDFDAETGVLSEPKLLVQTESPSYLTMSEDKEYVFAVNEGKGGSVSSFTWNANRSQLSLINQQPSEGDYPCYIELNKKENRLAVANYGTGNIAVYELGEQGSIGPEPTLIQHEGKGPVEPNQAGPRGHCAEFFGKYLYAVDLGIDQVISYPVSESGEVSSAVAQFSMEPGDGPRHIIFHPEKNIAFVVNELSATVVSLRVNPEKGVLEKISRVSILPEDFDGKNSSADIHLSHNGKFLYASNRGHNSIAIMAVGENGELERKGIESVRGETPRNFTLSPDNKFLLSANQGSNTITVFSVDPATGLLTFTGQEVAISRPVCLKF